MAEDFKPTDAHIESMKKAMVSAGILKATTLSAEDHAKLEHALAKEGINTELRPYKIICSLSHWCLVIKK